MGRDTKVANKVPKDDAKSASELLPPRFYNDDGDDASGAARRVLEWFAAFMVPGFGMFSEAYVLFAVGNVKNIFKESYWKCWDKHQQHQHTADCSIHLTNAVSYVEIAGVMLGMLLIGPFADRFGRRIGSITTAAFMLIGVFLQCISSGETIAGQFVMYTIGLGIFGFGVGGEYPLASSSAAERAEAAMLERRERLEREGKGDNDTVQQSRGKTVVLTFSMQGVGNWFNTVILLWLIWITNQTNEPQQYHNNNPSDKDYGMPIVEKNATYNDPVVLNRVWRCSYVFALIGLVFLFFGRLAYLGESKVWQEQKEAQHSGVASRSTGQKACLLFGNYWHRVIGCAIGWFVWDVTFYGNKLFQSAFIKDILGTQHPSIFETLKWTWVNGTVALVGYYVAAYTIDTKWMGRVRMQIMGFFFTFVLFLVCGFMHDDLKDHHIHLFQALYYISSFFGQWGPNATTWLLPSELFPTEVRAMGHGISAASGKAGALLAGIAFNYVDDKTKFVISGFCGLIGLIVTWLFVPNVTNLDLGELDDRWRTQTEEGLAPYDGPAVDPQNLSTYERMVGIGKRTDGVDIPAEQERLVQAA